MRLYSTPPSFSQSHSLVFFDLLFVFFSNLVESAHCLLRPRNFARPNSQITAVNQAGGLDALNCAVNFFANTASMPKSKKKVVVWVWICVSVELAELIYSWLMKTTSANATRAA